MRLTATTKYWADRFSRAAPGQKLPLASLLRFPLADLGESPHGKAQKKIYVGRMVSVITLAPDIVAAILDDTLLGRVTMFDLAADPPAP